MLFNQKVDNLLYLMTLSNEKLSPENFSRVIALIGSNPGKLFELGRSNAPLELHRKIVGALIDIGKVYWLWMATIYWPEDTRQELLRQWDYEDHVSEIAKELLERNQEDALVNMGMFPAFKAYTGEITKRLIESDAIKPIFEAVIRWPKENYQPSLVDYIVKNAGIPDTLLRLGASAPDWAYTPKVADLLAEMLAKGYNDNFITDWVRLMFLPGTGWPVKRRIDFIRAAAKPKRANALLPVLTWALPRYNLPMMQVFAQATIQAKEPYAIYAVVANTTGIFSSHAGDPEGHIELTASWRRKLIEALVRSEKSTKYKYTMILYEMYHEDREAIQFYLALEGVHI